MAALVLLVCIALAAVTYRFIERPFLTRKARIDR
jgi:peptidoglycan/LPS O-acetylase OafA/YrhL